MTHALSIHMFICAHNVRNDYTVSGVLTLGVWYIEWVYMSIYIYIHIYKDIYRIGGSLKLKY